MANLSPEAVAGLVKFYADTTQTGATFHTPLSADNGVKAVAICLAESGGKVDAKGGPNHDGTYDWGLWQINDVHHPDDNIKHYAAPNWQAAYSISGNGTNWKPWSTYNNGKYVQHMGAAAAAWQTAKPIDGHEAMQQAGLSTSGEVTNAPTDTQLSGPLAFLNPILDRNTWFRVGMGLAGVTLLLIFYASVVKDQELPAVLKALGMAADAKRLGAHATKIAAAPGNAAANIARSSKLGSALGTVAKV
jgi:Lysozyme like domain